LSAVPAAQERVEQQLQQRDLQRRSLVVLHYGTTWQTKLWSLDNWCRLACRLIDDGRLVPLLTWGNDEELQAATTISKQTAGGAIIWPRGSLPELVALLDRVDLVVGGDTGPVHIAAALGTPTVSLFRVTDATRNGPIGENHRRLQAPLECAGCLLKQCENDTSCAASIAVDDVYQAIVELTY
jgi:heptosyltransferase-1